LPTGPQTLPFMLLGYLLGRMYLSLGPAVMLLIIVPILIAREMFASYLSVKESHDETVQLLIRRSSKRIRTPPVMPSASRSTPVTSVRSSTSCPLAWSACISPR